MLRVRELRPPRRRLPLLAARLDGPDDLGRGRTRNLDHGLRERRPRVHGGGGTPIRHLRRAAPLAGHPRLSGRLRHQAPLWVLTPIAFAYSVSPAASRASRRAGKVWKRAISPSSKVASQPP